MRNCYMISGPDDRKDLKEQSIRKLIRFINEVIRLPIIKKTEWDYCNLMEDFKVIIRPLGYSITEFELPEE